MVSGWVLAARVSDAASGAARSSWGAGRPAPAARPRPSWQGCAPPGQARPPQKAHHEGGEAALAQAGDDGVGVLQLQASQLDVGASGDVGAAVGAVRPDAVGHEAQLVGRHLAVGHLFGWMLAVVAGNRRASATGWRVGGGQGRARQGRAEQGAAPPPCQAVFHQSRPAAPPAPTTLPAHLEAHHEAAGGALAAVEQARPLEAHVHVIQVQRLPARLALPALDWSAGGWSIRD